MSNDGRPNVDHSRVELLAAANNHLGEGPLWDHRTGSLYWLDITQSGFYCLAPADTAPRRIDLGRMGGSIHLTESPARMAVTSRDGLLCVNVDDGAVEIVGKPFALSDGVRFNDGKTDAAGRIWAGTMALDASSDVGELYCIRSGQDSEPMLGVMTIPNGLAWPADGETLFHIDTPTQSLRAFAFDPAAGALGSPRIACAFPQDWGAPDGMCIDSEDMVWIAFWGGACVRRINPRNGDLLDRIDLPAPHVTSCCLGGEDLRDLYITSARQGLDPAALAAAPQSGSVFRVRVAIPGRPEPISRIL